MGAVDAATWQALGLVLTLLGLGVSAVLWVRRGPASGLRGAAWSLLPLAAGLTGLLRLGWEITDSLARWATRLVFSPLVWLGIVVALVSGALFVVSGLLRRRGAARQPAAARPTAALPGKRSSRGAEQDDLADVEDILRKHGIT